MDLGIFTLTKRDQRAVILIVLALIGATIAKHYYDQKITPTEPISAQTLAAPTSISEENELEDDESP
jgi:hypothetical protein